MKPRIRILHLIETLGRGGAEGLLYTNLSKLNRHRFDGVVCHLYNRDTDWRQPILELGYPVISLGMTSLTDGVRGLLRLLNLLRREPVDLIHTHLYGANLIGRIVGAIKRIPVLSSLHNPDYDPVLLRDNPALSPAKLAVIRILDRITCLLANPHFLAVSEYVKHSAQQHLHLSPDRIQVIYNPLDVKHFDPTVVDSGGHRTALKIAQDSAVLLTVARYDPQKGLKYLIESVSLLRDRFPNVTVIFIGAGSAEGRHSYQELAGQLGVASQCRFLGIQADIRPYLKLCDIFVLPSLFEGLGIVLVEAMAMEKPCVATRVAAIPEVVTEGRSGILVEPADPPALATAIGRLLQDPVLRAQMGVEGRRVVLDRFNVEKNILELERLYTQIAGQE